MAAHYRKTQFGSVTAGLPAGGLAVCGAWGLLWGWRPPVLAVAGALVFGLVLFSSLTVEVGDVDVRCRFTWGLVRRSIPLARVRRVEVVRNPWYYGWGVRWIPGGWMFNVSGLWAVELRLEGGRRFRVGSGEPERLAEAIVRCRRQAGKRWKA